MTVYAVHSGEQLVRLVLRVRARDRGELRADIDAGLMADPLFRAPVVPAARHQGQLFLDNCLPPGKSPRLLATPERGSTQP